VTEVAEAQALGQRALRAQHFDALDPESPFRSPVANQDKGEIPRLALKDLTVDCLN
jgi:hypothetical protein